MLHRTSPLRLLCWSLDAPVWTISVSKEYTRCFLYPWQKSCNRYSISTIFDASGLENIYLWFQIKYFSLASWTSIPFSWFNFEIDQKCYHSRIWNISEKLQLQILLSNFPKFWKFNPSYLSRLFRYDVRIAQSRYARPGLGYFNVITEECLQIVSMFR